MVEVLYLVPWTLEKPIMIEELNVGEGWKRPIEMVDLVEKFTHHGGWTNHGSTEPQIKWQESDLYCYTAESMETGCKHPHINAGIPEEFVCDLGLGRVS